MAPPFKDAEFDILYGTGISKEGELVDLGSELGIIEKSGAWYALDGERIGQGRENTKDFLREHPDTAQTIEAKLRARFGLMGGAAATPAPSVEQPKSDAAKADARRGSRAT